MKDSMLKIENVSKQYRLGVVGTGTISHDLNRAWHRLRGKEDPYSKVGVVNDRSNQATGEYVWALKNISFDVSRGEVLGIIGKNGAGKSTLLKILSRVTGPTVGTIKSKGRIASLLEVGTGFHPELTGRENIFLNGAILGMTKAEVEDKLQEIISFSGCEMYIDTPTKRYSSGMRVRLAFAVAAHLEPDILVIDEVLAVGDAEFQKKAIGKMQDISKGEGRTVVFVSHDMAAIKNLCTRTIVLEHGSVSYTGDTDSAINFYLSSSKNNLKTSLKDRVDRVGGKKLRFVNIKIENEQGEILEELLSGETYRFKIDFKTFRNVKNVGFRLIFFDNNSQIRFLCNNHFTVGGYNFEDSIFSSVLCEIPRFPLPKGNYFIRLTCFSEEGVLDDIEVAYKFTVAGGDFFNSGKEQISKEGVLVENNFTVLKNDD